MAIDWNNLTNGYNNNGLYRIGKCIGDSVASFVIIFNYN